MKNLLVNLSRNRSLMVPLVTLTALTIGISGYYVQDRRIASSENAQVQVANQNDEINNDLKTYDSVEPQTQDVSQDSSDKKPATSTAEVAMLLSLDQRDDKYILVSSSDTDKPGMCTISLIQNSVTTNKDVETDNGKCEAEIPINPDQDYTVSVEYNSNDGLTMAYATSNEGL